MVCKTAVVPSSSGTGGDPEGQAQLNGLSLETSVTDLFFEVQAENLADVDNDIRIRYTIRSSNGQTLNEGSQAVTLPGLSSRRVSGSIKHNATEGEEIEVVAEIEDAPSSITRTTTVTSATDGGPDNFFRDNALLVAGGVVALGFAVASRNNGP